MVKNKSVVRIYIEGGSTGRVADGEFRKGWGTFLKELDDLARKSGFRKLQVVRGQSRSNAFGLFESSAEQNPGDLCVLLVDAEDQYEGDKDVWDVVAQREGDKWKKPDWATKEHLYFMKVTNETWILTDQDALTKFFGKYFKASVLPKTELEEREKKEIEKALEKASQPCKKKNYQHGYAHLIMEFVRPEKVKSLPHGKRFFEGVSALIESSK